MNITFLLGAGASANSLPVMENLSEDFEKVGNKLKELLESQLNQEYFKTLPPNIQRFNQSIKLIIDELEWLSKEVSNHLTVDTLAKLYFLQRNESLIRLKKILIFYFHYKQLTTKPDLRYDSFIACISKPAYGDTIELPGNIKILSWNYDMQLELSLKKYSPRLIEQIKNNFQILPVIETTENNISYKFDHSKFGVIKLNGNAFHVGYRNGVLTNSLDKITFGESGYLELMDSLIHDFHFLYHSPPLFINSTHYFNFAWESDSSFNEKHAFYNDKLSTAVKISENTDILVVVGYSFPVFNRSVDSVLIKRMRALKKIYILDKEPERIKSTMESAFKIYSGNVSDGNSQSVEFQLDKNLRQFPIPYELRTFPYLTE